VLFSGADSGVEMFDIGDRVTYGDQRVPGVIVGMKGTRVVVELEAWRGWPSTTKAVRAYRLHPPGEVGFVSRQQKRARASEVRRRIATGK
jgi:hypothetical protein